MTQPLHPYFKRLKRVLIAREQTFFIATTPGLEEICLKELARLPFPVKQVKRLKGGIEWTGRIHESYQANLSLHTANRILMRMGKFKASNPRQLKKKILSFPWELYISSGRPLTFHITTIHSRLYHKELVQDVFQKNITAYFEALTPPIPSPALAEQALSPPRLFIRIKDDEVHLSIDSSGDILYKRGIKLHAGEAPIRETLAAAALLYAGYSGQEILLDPMCGTGTFSLEAALLQKKIPPGLFRTFAFANWPCFRPQRWQFILNKALAGIVQPERPTIFASDTNHAGCAQLQDSLHSFNLHDTVRVFCHDFFDLTPERLTRYRHPGSPSSAKGLVIINPPYGIRLEKGSQANRLIQEIRRKLIHDFKGWRFAVIYPQHLTFGKTGRLTRVVSTTHGGLTIHIHVGRIKG